MLVIANHRFKVLSRQELEFRTMLTFFCCLLVLMLCDEVVDPCKDKTNMFVIVKTMKLLNGAGSNELDKSMMYDYHTTTQSVNYVCNMCISWSIYIYPTNFIHLSNLSPFHLQIFESAFLAFTTIWLQRLRFLISPPSGHNSLAINLVVCEPAPAHILTFLFDKQYLLSNVFVTKSNCKHKLDLEII